MSQVTSPFRSMLHIDVGASRAVAYRVTGLSQRTSVPGPESFFPLPAMVHDTWKQSGDFKTTVGSLGIETAHDYGGCGRVKT